MRFQLFTTTLFFLVSAGLAVANAKSGKLPPLCKALTCAPPPSTAIHWRP